MGWEGAGRGGVLVRMGIGSYYNEFYGYFKGLYRVLWELQGVSYSGLLGGWSVGLQDFVFLSKGPWKP